MKILQVIPYFPPAYAFGGPVTGAYLLSRELVRRGHEVTVYTTNAYNLSSKINIPFYRTLDGINVYSFNNLSMIPVKYSKLFITPNLIPFTFKDIKNYDIIHLHEYRTFQNVIVSFVSKHYRIPYILQANGSLDYLGRKIRKITFDLLWGYKILKNAAKLIALTKFEAEQYRSFNIPYEKIVIIPSTFDASKYEKLLPKGKFREKYNVGSDEKIVLYLGRIHKRKGIDILIEAFTQVIKKYHDVYLFIIGPDDGFQNQLQALIKNCGIEHKVVLTGPRYGREKLEALADADIFVMPSRYEAFSRSLREAMAFGKPVIASDVGGLRDLIKNRETGLLIEPGNIEQLQSAILYLLENPDKAKEMGQRGRKWITSNFSIKKIVDAVEHLYEEAIDQKHI